MANDQEMFKQLKKAQEIVKKIQEQEIQVLQSAVLSGRKIVELGLVHNMLDPKEQVQPAGIDFTLKRISHLESEGIIDFDNTKRTLPNYKEISFERNTLHLSPKAYLVEFKETVALPNNIIGIMRTRSSVFRSGATLTAGIIDPGYVGVIGALLQVWNEHGISLARNAKLVQWVFAEVSNPSEKGYHGRYKDAKKIF